MATSAQFATIPLDNPLWRHACQFYAESGVEQALLNLQDQYGADINMILQAHWLGSEGRVWADNCVSDEYRLWMAQHIEPLRKIRREMKETWVAKKSTEFEGFRQQVKKLELQAEQYGLALLYLAAGRQETEVNISKADLLKKNFFEVERYSSVAHHRITSAFVNIMFDGESG